MSEPRGAGEKNPLMRDATGRESADLAAFAAGLRFEHLPAAVVDRCVDFLVDWAGSALSGAQRPAILALQRFVDAMGPATGTAEITAPAAK